MHRNVVHAYCAMKETSRFFGGLIEWLGFSTAYLEVKHEPRFEGRSTYDLRRLVRMSLDGIVAFSNRPLYVSIGVGAVMSLFSAAYGVYQVLRYLLVGNIGVSGWVSTIAITSFIGGLILLNQGILGIYIARIYDQAKGRPIYVVDRVVRGGKLSARKE
jgi:dolichol-phosphate mannosyltransferase